MRKNLLLISFLSATGLLTNLVQGQTDRFVYAITDVQKGGSNWSYLRKLNLQSGEFSSILFDGSTANQVAFDATTNEQIKTFPIVAEKGYSTQPAFNSGVAAIAYDKKNNFIYYTPMFIDQLRYIDLNSMNVYYVTDQPFTSLPNKSSDQGSVVTRMVIAADGNGYALTNDATHLVRFKTGKNLVIEDLGTLVDASGNQSVSIHNSCSSFGGDIIADNTGNLYLISASNQIFRINIDTKIATLIGKINGLPSDFTVNGAAVDANNQILVSSAVNESNYYTIDPETWTAKAFKSANGIWRSSDLANGNILNTQGNSSGTDVKILALSAGANSNLIQIYPNPVTDKQFTIQFSKMGAGNYILQVTDVMGQQVLQQKMNIVSGEQSENINLNPLFVNGIYLIKVINQDNKSVFSGKIIVQ